jgi:L-asparaginase II
LKIEDGAKRAAAGAAMALVERLYPAARGLMPVGAIKTWRGSEVGAVRSSSYFEGALASLKV